MLVLDWGSWQRWGFESQSQYNKKIGFDQSYESLVRLKQKDLMLWDQIEFKNEQEMLESGFRTEEHVFSTQDLSKNREHGIGLCHSHNEYIYIKLQQYIY